MKVHLMYSRGHEEEKPSMNSLTRKTASFDVDAQRASRRYAPMSFQCRAATRLPVS